MSARRIAVLVGSHDPAYFARYTQPDRPSEAAVLAALRAQRSTSEPNHRASATQSPTRHRRSTARHTGARADADTRRAHARGPAGLPRISVLAAAARTRRPIRHTRARLPAGVSAGA